MERNVMWSPWSGPGLEHLYLRENYEQIAADGLILGVKDQVPFRVHYEITCDLQWRVRTVHLQLLSGQKQALALHADGEGNWTSAAGEKLASLHGCLDVDLSASPFTNTLPIRRVAFEPGASVTLTVVYLSVPELTFYPAQQRYTCLEKSPTGGLYRYESLDSDFRADLPVDDDGLVLDYPGLFRRVGSWLLYTREGL